MNLPTLCERPMHNLSFTVPSSTFSRVTHEIWTMLDTLDTYAGHAKITSDSSGRQLTALACPRCQGLRGRLHLHLPRVRSRMLLVVGRVPYIVSPAERPHPLSFNNDTLSSLYSPGVQLPLAS